MKTKVVHLNFACLSHLSLNCNDMPIIFSYLYYFFPYERRLSFLQTFFSAFYQWRTSSGKKVYNLKNIHFIIFFTLNNLLVIMLSFL